MILMIDNYDSFTYNLYQYLGELGADVTVVRNDAVSAEAMGVAPPEGLLISPGPGNPDEAGISLAAIEALAGVRPVLGVCLGHQCIGQLYGGHIVRAPVPVHGKTSAIYHNGQGVFAGLPNPFQATRYHSLVIDRATCPDVLEITAWTDDGLIMGVRHRELPIEGVQFHPESIMTEGGKQLLDNFLAQVSAFKGDK
ncbi:MAG TPA: aminodeoxychorismate/anthranilate synthase component II [Chloroflexia bacterium]|nr:aminodeoxychorismate/anthranilate synthase component II [Chloroflexia bacterium]